MFEVCVQCNTFDLDIALVTAIAPLVALAVEAITRRFKLDRFYSIVAAVIVGIVLAVWFTRVLSVPTALLGVLAALVASGGYSWVKKVFDLLATRSEALGGKPDAAS